MGEEAARPPVGGGESDDVDFFEKRRCNDGFLSLFARTESGVRGESLTSPAVPENLVGEKLGRERMGIDRRFSDAVGEAGRWVVSDADEGKCMGPVMGIGLLITGLLGVVGDKPMGEGSAIMGPDVPWRGGGDFFSYISSSTALMCRWENDGWPEDIEGVSKDSADEVRRGGDCECE